MYELLTATNPEVVNVMLSGPFLQEHFGLAIEAKAHRKVFELRAAYDEAFKQVDIHVTLCAPTVAMPHPKMEAGSEGPSSSIIDKLAVVVGVTTTRHRSTSRIIQLSASHVASVVRRVSLG